MLGLLILGTIGTYQPQSQLSRMSTRLPTAAGGGNSSLPKYLTIYVLLAGIGGGLFFVVVVLYCCKICMGRRLSFDILSRESIKDNEGAAGGGGGGGSGENQQHGNGTNNGGNTSSTTGAGASSGMEKKTCVVQYSGGGTQILMTGGLQRKVSEEHQPSYPSPLSRSPRDVEGFKTCSNSGGGRGDDIQYKIGATPPHSPHYLTSTVISIEPAHNRNDSPSSSSSSLQLDHHSNKNSELPSPRSPKSRHNSGGSSLSRCGSRGSTARENRASMKSIPSRNSSFRRPVGGSLKDSKSQLRRARGGSSGDSYLTINHDSPRRSVSLRSPRHPPSRSPQSKEPNLLPLGLYIGSENSVNAGRGERHEHKKFNPSPTMSTHSVISGQWTPLEAGLEWWKRKHNLQLVQYEGTEQSLSGKFRYNDIGSMEDIRGGDVSDYLFVDSNEDNETPTMEIQPQQIKHQYRALWELRATLEEEDWAAAKNPPKVLRMPGGPSLSPTIPPKEDTQALLASSVSYSTEQSPDRDPLSSHTTSFESNTEPIFIDEPGAGPSGSREHKEVFHHLGPTSHASLASRRQSYKNVLHNRMKRIERSASIMQETGNVTETTTSFDSIETQESTSTDTSRLEAITTSIESTDNTDSTGESHQYQQQLGKFQFRTDSGYKSLENGGPSTTNQSNALPAHRLLPRRCLSSGSSVDASSSSHSRQPLLGTTPRGGNNGNVNNTSPRSNPDDPDSTSPVFFAKVGQLPPSNHRNVTRKRREFGGRFERHSIGSMDSVREPLDEECGGGEGGQGRAKGSLFYRYFKNPRSNSAYYTRDYSIDEKSDQLFREFSRCDPTFDMSSFTTTSRPTGKIYCRRNSLARGATSLDLGSQPRSNTSPNVSPNNSPYLTTKSLANKKPSPHDSVDDELPLLVTDNSRVLPLSSSRFHNVPAHASIPIITVDDS